MRSRRVPSAKAQVNPCIDTAAVSVVSQASIRARLFSCEGSWISALDLTITVCLSWHTFIISKTSLGRKDDFSHKFLESWKNFGHVYLG